MNASVQQVNMKERQRDAPLPRAAPPGQRESLDKSPHYTFQAPCRKEEVGPRGAVGGARERLTRWADEGMARLSSPGVYRVTEPYWPPHLAEGAPPAYWGLDEAEDQRRRSYPFRGSNTTGSSFQPPHRSSFTPRTTTPAAMYCGRTRLGEGLVFHQDGGRYLTPGMHTFRPLSDPDRLRDARRDVRRGGSREPPLLDDVSPPDSLYPSDDAYAGGRKTFLTEAVPCNSRLSDSPDSRRTSQTEVLTCEPSDLRAAGLWDYNMWREGRSPSCCSTNTIYANTSDPGAPEPTYENVFECLLRESSVPPVASPPAATPCCAEEPIYATLGEQLRDGECITDFRCETPSPRDHPEDPRPAPAIPSASGSACMPEDDVSDSSATSSEDEFSPSASTLTLRPGVESKASAAESRDAVSQDEANDFPNEADQSGVAAAAATGGRDTPPPTLPPKLLHKKPPGLKLHIPGAASPTGNHGLQAHLPLEREGSLSMPSPTPLDPTDSTTHEGGVGSVETGHSAPRQGSLYVVVGSSASPGEPYCWYSTNTLSLSFSLKHCRP